MGALGSCLVYLGLMLNYTSTTAATGTIILTPGSITNDYASCWSSLVYEWQEKRQS